MDLESLLIGNGPTLAALLLVYVRLEKTISRMDTNQRWLAKTITELPCNQNPPSKHTDSIPIKDPLKCPQT